VRRNAAYALGRLGDSHAADGLLAALSDESVSAMAAAALVKLKEPRLFDELMRALDDDKKRNGVASDMGELGDARAVEPLMGLPKRTDVQIRRNAVLAPAGESGVCSQSKLQWN